MVSSGLLPCLGVAWVPGELGWGRSRAAPHLLARLSQLFPRAPQLPCGAAPVQLRRAQGDLALGTGVSGRRLSVLLQEARPVVAAFSPLSLWSPEGGA